MRAFRPMTAVVVLLGFLLSAGGAALAQDSDTRVPADKLDQMAVPVALYPDNLLSQILMASTYPLEIVQADRWAQSTPNMDPKERGHDLPGQPSWHHLPGEPGAEHRVAGPRDDGLRSRRDLDSDALIERPA